MGQVHSGSCKRDDSSMIMAVGRSWEAELEMGMSLTLGRGW